MAGTLQANTNIKQLPSIVGPSVYELYTDAKLFVTRVYVNNKKLKLSNAEGNGSMAGSGFSFSGPMGYENKTLLNAHLKAGINEIKVVFEPSSILDDAKKENAENIIIRDMYAHVVITRGVLNDSRSGVESYDLDQMILIPEKNAVVLENKLLRRFSSDKLSQEVSVTYQLKLAATDKIEQIEISNCSLSSNSSTNFSATLMLNDIPIQEITDNSSSGLEYFSDAIRSGENIWKLTVKSINAEKDKNYLELYLKCNLKDAIEKIGFLDEHTSLDFGDSYKSVHLALSVFKFNEKGEYSNSFNIDY